MNPLLLAGALVAGWYYLRMRRNPEWTGWFGGDHKGSRETVDDLIDNERTVAEARQMAHDDLHDFYRDGWPDYDELQARIDHMPAMGEDANSVGQKVIAAYVQTLERELPKMAERIEREQLEEEAEADRVGR